MGYKLIYKTRKIPRDFYIYNNDIYYRDLSEKNIHKINESFNEEIFISYKSVILNIIKNILYYTESNFIFKHNLDNDIIVKTPLPSNCRKQIKIYSDKGYLINLSKYDNPNEWQTIYINFKGEEIKKFNNGFPSSYSATSIDEYTFIIYDKKSIGVFGFDNKVRWMKRIARLGRSKEAFIHSDFQIYKNDLYFAISGTPDNKTFCIDVKTGKVKHKYKELIMFSRIQDDKLYNLFAGNLHILDLHSQRMHKINLTSEFKKYNISTDAQYEVKSGLVYFKQSMGEVARIGIIDPLLEKVVWTYEFPNECGQVGTIRVAGNRIYAHTQDFTLHIFEREE